MKKNVPGFVVGMHLNFEQTGEIKGAASLAIIKLTHVIAYPTLIGLDEIDSIIDQLNRVKAIVYELDAKCSHDNSTAVADGDGLKEAA